MLGVLCTRPVDRSDEKRTDKMKFVHISDVFLGTKLPEEAPAWQKDREKDARETFEKIVTFCSEEKVDLLLIAGNLFAAPPTGEDLAWLDEKLSAVEHLRTVMLSGPADFAGPGAPIANYQFRTRTAVLPANRTTNAYLKGINTCVTGVSYGREEYRDRILEDIGPGRSDAINILLASGGDKKHMPFRKDVLAQKGFQYVALGGKREPVHILKNRMAYSGSPEPFWPEETGRRGFILGEIVDGKTEIKFCHVNKRTFIDLEVQVTPSLSDEEIQTEVENRIMKLGIDNIYSIILRGFASDDMNPDFNRISERFFISRIMNLTIPEKDLRALRIENSGNLAGSFVNGIELDYSVDDKIRERAERYGLEALIIAEDRA